MLLIAAYLFMSWELSLEYEVECYGNTYSHRLRTEYIYYIRITFPNILNTSPGFKKKKLFILFNRNYSFIILARYFPISWALFLEYSVKSYENTFYHNISWELFLESKVKCLGNTSSPRPEEVLLFCFLVFF